MRGALYPSVPGSRRIDSIRSASKPGLKASRAFSRLRTNRPPATSTTTESDSCTTTSALRSVNRRAPWLLPLSPGLSEGMRLVRTACQAGAHPKARPVANDSASAQPSSRRSGVKFRVIGSWTFSGIVAARTAAVQNVSSTATVPAVSASSVLSVSSWRTTRQRPAPIARRMAISRRLTVALARNRLATLPHGDEPHES